MKYLIAALIVVMVYIETSSLWPMPNMESSYNHQRVTDQHIAAIAKLGRDEARPRAWKYIRTEDGR